MKEVMQLGIEQQFDKAEAICDEVLQDLKPIFECDDPVVIEVMVEQLEILVASGQFDKAEPVAEQVLEAQRRRLGDDSAETIETMVVLGTMYLHLGKLKVAEQVLTEGWKRSKARRDTSSHSYAEAVKNLCILFCRTSELVVAQPLCEEYWEILNRNHPETNEEVLRWCLVYSTLLLALEQPRQVLEMLRPRYNIMVNVFGHNHPDTLQGLTTLAHTAHVMKSYEAAEKLYRESLRLYREINPNLPEVAEVQECLQRCLQESIDHHEQGMKMQQAVVKTKEELKKAAEMLSMEKKSHSEGSTDPFGLDTTTSFVQPHDFHSS